MQNLKNVYKESQQLIVIKTNLTKQTSKADECDHEPHNLPNAIFDVHCNIWETMLTSKKKWWEQSPIAPHNGLNGTIIHTVGTGQCLVGDNYSVCAYTHTNAINHIKD